MTGKNNKPLRVKWVAANEKRSLAEYKKVILRKWFPERDLFTTIVITIIVVAAILIKAYNG